MTTPNWDRFHEFEKRLIASTPVDFERNLRLADAMWAWAKELGVVPGANPLEGVELHTRMAKVFQSVDKSRSSDAGPPGNK
jgi:hypothetical protein